MKNRLADHTAGRSNAEDEEQEKQHDEQPRQERGGAERRTGDRRESKQRCDQADDEKYQRHVQHGPNLHYELLRSSCHVLRLSMHDAAFLIAAIAEAEQGLREGGIPIGAVLVHGERILGRGHNRRVQQGSAVLHGEMDALERAGRQPAAVYRGCVMYTTLSPCAMCAGAILLYGIPYVVVGENRTFMGEEEWLRARGVRVDVVQDERCIAMMRSFIATNPDLWNEDIGV